MVIYQAIAEATMLIHFAFLAYVVFGGFLAWRWPRTIWLHAVCAGWGFSSVAFGLECPLTSVEDWGRRRAGEAGLANGFIDTYLTGVLYPESASTLLQFLAGAVVLTSWIGFALRRRAKPGL